MHSDQTGLYPWLKDDWRAFLPYIEQQRIPQALLLSGHAGLGKSIFSKHIAQALVCESPQADGLYCNHCHACTLFKAQTHPDVLFVHPEETGKNIVISQIRKIIESLALAPQYSNYRIVIIDPADLMNAAAANAFLKCLEEPSPKTVMILISSNPEKLPATIRSRCQKFKIDTPEAFKAEQWLKQQHAELDSQLLLKLSQGAPLLADKLAKDNMLETRRQCFNEWLAIFKQQKSPVWVAENWLKQDPVLINQWVLTWVMDIIRYYYYQSPTICYNPDLTEQLQTLSKTVHIAKLDGYYQLLLHNESKLQTQINKQLLLEQCLILWSGTNLRY